MLRQHDLYTPIRHVMIHLDPNAKPAEAARLLNRASARPEWLSELARRGRAVALRHLTCDAKVARLIDAVELYQAGRRGIYLPHATALDCHRFMPLRNAFEINGGIHPNESIRALLPWCDRIVV